ncbi:MAG: MFS transporter, partial [Rhodospirillales bacterium]|nr:MFS transporter [Rhodospirillales bacterium]
MSRNRVSFLFLNLGHFFDHLIILVFATSAALVLVHEWAVPYSELIPYATPGLIAFGVGALPAGWIADKWSREAMMVVFFLGLGVAGTATALADTPLQIGVGLFLIGLFASIYHPVGLALVVEGRRQTGMPLAINGVFGNMGVACAALLTGWLIDVAGWRAAFAVPGTLCFALGCAYAIFLYGGRRRPRDLEPHQPD